MVEEEQTEIAQPPPPVPPGEDEQQQWTEEHKLGGEEEEYDLPDVDLGAEEEESEEADPHFLDTMRERLAVLKDTPLPEQYTPLPGEQMPLPREDPPLPETPPQSEGMTTRSQTRAGGGKIRHIPSTRATRQQVHQTRPQPPARESTGQAQQQQALEDEDKSMQRRGQLQAHAEDEDRQDGLSVEKRVFNRGERREHDVDWEEPLLKRIKHLREMTMRAEAARAGNRLKHAVIALSVVGYEAGRRDLYRRLASITDLELLAALAAGNFELILEGSTFPPGTNGPARTPQTMLNTGQGTRENARTLEQGPPPQRPPTLQQPGPASHHPARMTSNKGHPGRGKQTEDSRTGTAKHSRATTARNSPGDTSHRQAGLKRSCQQPSKELQPMAGRHVRQRRKRSNAIGPEYSARESSRYTAAQL
jgi:hypothetical protein